MVTSNAAASQKSTLKTPQKSRSGKTHTPQQQLAKKRSNLRAQKKHKIKMRLLDKGKTEAVATRMAEEQVSAIFDNRNANQHNQQANIPQNSRQVASVGSIQSPVASASDLFKSPPSRMECDREMALLLQKREFELQGEEKDFDQQKADGYLALFKAAENDAEQRKQLNEHAIATKERLQQEAMQKFQDQMDIMLTKSAKKQEKIQERLSSINSPAPPVTPQKYPANPPAEVGGATNIATLSPLSIPPATEQSTPYLPDEDDRSQLKPYPGYVFKSKTPGTSDKNKANTATAVNADPSQVNVAPFQAHNHVGPPQPTIPTSTHSQVNVAPFQTHNHVGPPQPTIPASTHSQVNAGASHVQNPFVSQPIFAFSSPQGAWTSTPNTANTSQFGFQDSFRQRFDAGDAEGDSKPAAKPPSFF